MDTSSVFVKVGVPSAVFIGLLAWGRYTFADALTDDGQTFSDNFEASFGNLMGKAMSAFRSAEGASALASGVPVFGGSGHGQKPMFGQDGHGQAPVFGGSGHGQKPMFGQNGHGQAPVIGRTGQAPVIGRTGHGQKPMFGQNGHGQAPVFGGSGHGQAPMNVIVSPSNDVFIPERNLPNYGRGPNEDDDDSNSMIGRTGHGQRPMFGQNGHGQRPKGASISMDANFGIVGPHGQKHGEFNVGGIIGITRKSGVAMADGGTLGNDSSTWGPVPNGGPTADPNESRDRYNMSYGRCGQLVPTNWPTHAGLGYNPGALQGVSEAEHA